MHCAKIKIPLSAITIPKIIAVSKVGWKVKYVDSCGSTNASIKGLKSAGELHDRTALVADFQTNGRGQASNTWHSSKGENLLASYYLKVDINVQQHFMLNVVASLAICSVVENYEVECKIKWPNDIYVSNKKLAGILIENTLMRDVISESIIGIGLNVNETCFPECLPNPCALHSLVGKKLDVKNIGEALAVQIEDNYKALMSGGGDALFARYLEKLYRINERHCFIVGEKQIMAKIVRVERDGQLILKGDSGLEQGFLFGELAYKI